MTTYSDIIVDRALGSLVGLAVGDALGTTFESGPRRPSDTPVTMVGGGPHHLTPGQWTDDTAMALCLADSLITNRGRVNHRDLMTRFSRWMTDGHNSCTGAAFDVGWTTRGSISEFIETGDPITGPTGRDGAGNGGVMRLAPAVIANLDDTDRAARASVEQSRTTHGAPQCIEGADLLARRLHGLITRPEDVPPHEVSSSGDYRDTEIIQLVVSQRSPADREAIRSTGYVVHTLEAAMWSFATTFSFEEALTRAINLGGDTDTVGAVAGQIAGAAYGLSSIPPAWLERLAWRDEIVARGRSLIDLSKAHNKTSPLKRLFGSLMVRS
jgi:ADP-ribosyl-[dinitrogen reductase] hydrolase